MKLLVIVLCLICERFIVHVRSHQRFFWFPSYCKTIEHNLAGKISTPWMVFLCLILPVLLTTWMFFYLFNGLLFGFVGLLFNIAIFYYCIGPANPFYPVRKAPAEQTSQDEVGTYFAIVNGQLFAVIFWYIVAGPLFLLAYRVTSLCGLHSGVTKQAQFLTDILEWVPAKITSMLYLLVGNFQAGLRHFFRLFFTIPGNNQTMLSVCGLEALGQNEPLPVLIPQAEVLVEHAVIALLVLLSMFTLIAWL